jgi:hypothetical protein
MDDYHDTRSYDADMTDDGVDSRRPPRSNNEAGTTAPETSPTGAESSYPPPAIDPPILADRITVITPMEPPMLSDRAAQAILRILIKAAETEGIL